MISHECLQAMTFQNIFEAPEAAEAAAKALENALGGGVTINKKPVQGGTEVRADLSCKAYKASHGGRGCLLQAMEAGGINIPRISRPTCSLTVATA